MKRTLLVLLVLASCSKTNDVALLLGPTEDRLSRGFLCKDDTGAYLMQRAVSGSRLSFALVIDVLAFRDSVPGCRGEELLLACGEPGRCNGPVQRTCVPVDDVAVTAADLDDPQGLLAKVKAQLAAYDAPLVRDAPDEPVLVRVVAMPGTCADYADPQTPLAGDTALGCAYSCPVQLDQVRGSISVSLDALDDRCAPQVRACAAFEPG